MGEKEEKPAKTLRDGSLEGFADGSCSGEGSQHEGMACMGRIMAYKWLHELLIRNSSIIQ